MVVAAVLAVALIASIGVIIFLRRGGASRPSVAAASQSPVVTSAVATEASPATAQETSAVVTPTPTEAASSAPPPTPTPTPTLSADQLAKQGLDDLVRSDAPEVSFDGHYVAQLASKALGTVDPLDPPPSGAAAWTWPDIYDQHMQLRDDLRFSGSVRLVLSTSFGRGITTRDGRPYYVTVFDGGFTSSAEVTSWCEQTFADLPAKVRANSCTVARLTPA